MAANGDTMVACNQAAEIGAELVVCRNRVLVSLDADPVVELIQHNMTASDANRLPVGVFSELVEHLIGVAKNTHDGHHISRISSCVCACKLVAGL